MTALVAARGGGARARGAVTSDSGVRGRTRRSVARLPRKRKTLHGRRVKAPDDPAGVCSRADCEHDEREAAKDEAGRAWLERVAPAARSGGEGAGLLRQGLPAAWAAVALGQSRARRGRGVAPRGEGRAGSAGGLVPDDAVQQHGHSSTASEHCLDTVQPTRHTSPSRVATRDPGSPPPPASLALALDHTRLGSHEHHAGRRTARQPPQRRHRRTPGPSPCRRRPSCTARRPLARATSASNHRATRGSVRPTQQARQGRGPLP